MKPTFSAGRRLGQSDSGTDLADLLACIGTLILGFIGVMIAYTGWMA